MALLFSLFFPAARSRFQGDEVARDRQYPFFDLTSGLVKRGNLAAMVCGFIVVAFLSGLHNNIWNLLHPSDTDFLAWMAGHPKGPAFQHWHWEWLPTIDFPWRITAGTLVTAAVALIFRTPPDHRNAASLPHAAQSFYLSPPSTLTAPRSPLKSP